MRTFPILVAGLLAATTIGCEFQSPQRPSLVVLVVVDQLRADLLDRYDPLFSGGLRRLRDGGFRFTAATHDHAKTATGPGHTTLGTGVFPARSGIVGNDWLERNHDGWQSVYCMEDTSTHILGYPAMEGRSPQNLLRGGLADWILESDSAAMVVSASRKDRAAIGMAAKARGHVYWITENQGQFVTSTFYRNAYPGWVERFNLEAMPRIFGDSVWEQTLSLENQALSRRDTVAYEGDGEHTHFPHVFLQESPDPSKPTALNRWAYGQLHPDRAVADFASEAIRELGLGQDGATDYLALSFSQTDAIGHDYGPFSREVLEDLVHLDGLLGALMDHLDDAVGEGNWVMAFTADHGVMAIPEFRVEEGLEGGRPTRQDLSNLRSVFRATEERGREPLEVAGALVSSLEELPFIEDAFPVGEMISGPPPDSFAVLFRNSYHPDRWHWGYGSQGSGVLFRFSEFLYPDPLPRGTGHGSPYYYDRHVPLVLFGPGVPNGSSADPVRTVDIAPTLAVLAGISIPSDLDGTPLFR